MMARLRIVALSAALVASAMACPRAFSQTPDAEPPCRAAENPANAARCEQAIASEPDAGRRAVLLFQRAYARNERERYEEALSDLNEALALAPRSAIALHERAYTLNALGRYSEAETDLNAQAVLTPDDRTVYQERAFARFYQGDLTGAFADRDREVALAPGDGAAYLARGEAEMWLGRFDDARRDIDAASALAIQRRDAELQESASAASEALALWRTVSSGDPAQSCLLERMAEQPPPQHVIGDCTALFLRAGARADAANALTTRSVAWRLIPGRLDDGVTDLRLAVALDPDNWQWRANLGGGYLSVRHSWAARIEFDRSLALHADGNYIAYAGRGRAAYNLGDMQAALDDSRTSLEIRPNEVALTTLGDVALNHFHDANAAKQYWLNAYRLGSRDDRLMERLRSVGVADPEQASPAP